MFELYHVYIIYGLYSYFKNGTTFAIALLPK